MSHDRRRPVRAVRRGRRAARSCRPTCRPRARSRRRRTTTPAAAERRERRRRASRRWISVRSTLPYAARVDAHREARAALSRVPGRSTSRARTGVTIRASGSAAICATHRRGARTCAPPSPGRAPIGWTVKSRAKRRSIWSGSSRGSSTDSALLTTTTERPIVSATAVAAVRRGFAARRRRPAARRSGDSRRSGTASSRDQRRDQRTARPAPCRRTSPSSAAMPTHRRRARRRRCVAEPERAAEDSSRAGTARAPTSARARAGRARHVAPRRARRGSARRAPRAAPARARPASVATMPDDDRGDGRAGADATACRPACRSPACSAIRPTREAEAERRARARCRPAPITSASIRTVRMTMPRRGAERAQHPELAHALQHGHVERVEDQEAADEQRDAREEVEDDVERLRAAWRSRRRRLRAS